MELLALLLIACVLYSVGWLRQRPAIWNGALAFGRTLLKLAAFATIFGVVLLALGVSSDPGLLGTLGFGLALLGRFVLKRRRTAQARRRAQAEERARLQAQLARTEAERRRHEAEQTAAAETERRREAARERCQQARVNCEAFFLRHAPELRSRFGHDQLEEFMRRHLHDKIGSEEVQRREAELLALMEHHLQLGERKPKKRTLTDLINWFAEEKRRVEGMDLSPEDEEQIIRGLEDRFTRLQSEHIRQMQP